MKKLRQIVESVSDEHLFHTSFHNKPIDGVNNKFKKPVTWFYSNRHDNSSKSTAVDEAKAMMSDGTSTTGVYKPNKKLNLANEKDVSRSMREIGHPTAPDEGDNNDGGVWENLDVNANGDKENTDKLVSHLKKQGFHGVEHQDYSQINHNNDRKSIALFNPHEHLNLVSHHTTTDSLNKYSNKQIKESIEELHDKVLDSHGFKKVSDDKWEHPEQNIAVTKKIGRIRYPEQTRMQDYDTRYHVHPKDATTSITLQPAAKSPNELNRLIQKEKIKRT